MLLLNPGIDVSLFGESSVFFPDGARAANIERQLLMTLPPIAGLDVADLSLAERDAVYSIEVRQSRLSFIELYGDPFDCDPVEVSPVAENKWVIPKTMAIA